MSRKALTLTSRYGQRTSKWMAVGRCTRSRPPDCGDARRSGHAHTGASVGNREPATRQGRGLAGDRNRTAAHRWAVRTIGALDGRHPPGRVTIGPSAFTCNPTYVGWSAVSLGFALVPNCVIGRRTCHEWRRRISQAPIRRQSIRESPVTRRGYRLGSPRIFGDWNPLISSRLLTLTETIHADLLDRGRKFGNGPTEVSPTACYSRVGHVRL